MDIHIKETGAEVYTLTIRVNGLANLKSILNCFFKWRYSK